MKTLPKIRKTLLLLSPLAKSLGVTKMHIIGSYAIAHRSFSKGNPLPPRLVSEAEPSDLDILCRWKSKHHWAANSNALAEYLSASLKIKIDLTAPFHHRNQSYNINKIPSIRIFYSVNRNL